MNDSWLTPGGRDRRNPESGHLILIVMMGLVVMSILLGAVVQQWSVIERRDDEAELIFRGNQYVRAIRQYQVEHGGALPTSLEILLERGPRQGRYIRRLYKDPFAPDGKWGILLADPSGRGYINPNAPNPTGLGGGPAVLGGGGGIPGLEDLGQGFQIGNKASEMRLKASSMRNQAIQNKFLSDSGFGDTSAFGDFGGEESVTAPGQPKGPIVGVVSLHDESTFRLYKEHSNYAEWAFHIFDLPETQQEQKQKTAVPLTPSGIGPGGRQTIINPSTGETVGGDRGGGMPNTPGAFGNRQPPKSPKDRNNDPN